MNQEPHIPETEELPTPSPQEKPNKPPALSQVASSLFDAVEMFAWAVFAVILIFTFALRLCRVDGSSMENTLFDGENLLISDLFYTPEQNDIVVFHLTEPTSPPDLQKTLVKRVIATEGQMIRIDFSTGEILIDGILYDDPYHILKDGHGRPIDSYINTADYVYLYTANPHYDVDKNVLTATVPAGHVFVMGDNRRESLDSRILGVQSMDNMELKLLGRIHSVEEFQENYQAARKAGFSNINIDLITAVPDQTKQSYLYTLEKVLALEPEHISAYSLIIEPDTPFEVLEAEGKLNLPDEEEERRMYAVTKEVLAQKGYDRYDSDRWCRYYI